MGIGLWGRGRIEITESNERDDVLYSKYNLTVSDYFYNKEINKHLASGTKIYKEHEGQARKKLKDFIYDNGHIDGSAMKSNWFQIENVDIFISHSHQDLNKVMAFAGWLYDEFKLTAFIDSCVWGYCDELLKQIDNEYCKKSDGKTYNYNLRNYTTSHVHMMLSTALTEMIDYTECIMFYNTPNSVCLESDLKEIKKEKPKVTLSPWIYHELAMTSLIKRSELKRTVILIEKAIEHRAFSEQNEIMIEHDINKYLNEMISIDSETLSLWAEKYAILTHKMDGDMIPNIRGYENIFPLDVLYQMSNLSSK